MKDKSLEKNTFWIYSQISLFGQELQYAVYSVHL